MDTTIDEVFQIYIRKRWHVSTDREERGEEGWGQDERGEKEGQTITYLQFLHAIRGLLEELQSNLRAETDD